MEFQEWWDKEGQYIWSLNRKKTAKIFMEAAYLAGADSVKSLPHRAMFDDGFARGQKEAAKECIKLIMEWEGSWSVLDFRDAIKEKFELEI